MADIDVNQLLMQMRTMAAAAKVNQPNPTQQTGNTTGADFAQLLKQSVNQVNENQMGASKLVESFAKGDPSADLTQVMVAVQKASLSFQAMTQVRNKLVQAYQEVMNMQM